MILYFSGTGNSEYVAEQIGAQIGDEVLNLFERLKNHDHSEIHSQKPYVFVYPTYAWQMPVFLQKWIERTVLSGSDKAYFVTTCGSSKGDTEQNLRALCRQKGFQYMGCAGVVMPENYIAMFNAPEREEAIRIIENAAPTISKAADAIGCGARIEKEHVSLAEKISSRLVNKAFYPLCVSDRKFHTLKSCTGCGMCADVCPLNNVTVTEGRPVWGGACTHCMACICKCPQEAIEYGNKSKGKPRYICPL